MKTLITVLIFLAPAAFCSAQTSLVANLKSDSVTYRRTQDESSWGFVNGRGDTVIPLGIYTFLNPIDDRGMILARIGNTYGYIDVHQKRVVPFEYDDIGVFSEDLAFVKKKGKYGYINRAAEIVIPCRFHSAGYFRKSQIAQVELNNKWGFIDKTGRAIIPIIYKEVDYNNEDTVVTVRSGLKWAFFSRSGKKLTNFIFDGIYESQDHRNMRYTYFGNGLALVKANKKFAYINQEFQEVVPFGIYSTAEPLNSDRLAIVSREDKWGIIDGNGDVVVPLESDTIKHPRRYSNVSPTFILEKNGSIQLLDRKARPLTDSTIQSCEWDYSTEAKGNSTRFFLIEKEGKVGVLSEEGSTIIPCIYAKILPFNGRSVTVAKKGKAYGLIDYRNEVILQFENEKIYSDRGFKYFVVQRDSSVGVVDENGKIIIPFEYQEIDPCFYDENNRYIVKKDGKYGVIDINGVQIIAIAYREISNWVEYDPREHICLKESGLYDLVSREGNVVQRDLTKSDIENIITDNCSFCK